MFNVNDQNDRKYRSIYIEFMYKFYIVHRIFFFKDIPETCSIQNVKND